MILLYGYILYWILAAIGITWGYHRYFAHGGKQQHPVLEIIYLYFGLLCGGRSLLTWAGVHRMHHAYTDTENDPHSAKYHPWYVILFSLWTVNSIPRKFIKDLMINSRVMFFHKYGNYIFVTHCQQDFGATLMQQFMNIFNNQTVTSLEFFPILFITKYQRQNG